MVEKGPTRTGPPEKRTTQEKDHPRKGPPDKLKDHPQKKKRTPRKVPPLPLTLNQIPTLCF